MMKLPWKKAVHEAPSESLGHPSRMRRVRVRISRLFRRTARSSPAPIAFPEVDLYDSPREVVLRVDTHDLEPRDIQIRLKGKLLSLVGKPETGGGTRSPTAAFRRSV